MSRPFSEYDEIADFDKELATEVRAFLIELAEDDGRLGAYIRDRLAFLRESGLSDAARVWSEAADAGELRANIAALPGFGEMKVKALGAVLAKRFGVATAQELIPSHPTLADVDSNEARERYQAAKRAYKASMKRS